MVAPVLLALTGGAVDYGFILRQKATLQSAVDAAALAAARELSLSDSNRENVDEVVKSVAVAHLRVNEDARDSAAPAKIATIVRDMPLEVDVTATQAPLAPFGLLSGLVPKVVKARSVARVVGQPNICVLGLNRSAEGTISLEHMARVTGTDCAVFSNSDHANAIKSKNSATLRADFICSRGGKDGGPGNFDPQPLTDCPGFADPLGSRPEPSVGPCNDSMPTEIHENKTLSPGTYCGGLTIAGSARVTLNPGIYVFKDGPLVVSDTAEIKGNGVGLFFTGDKSAMTLGRKTTVSLAAPTTGVMAGLLMFSSRGNQPSKESGQYRILSNNARTLVGTIYLPTGELHIDADEPIADHSAYTAIVANTMRLFGGPHLVLNTDYDQTDVPVPTGIKGAGQPAALVE